MLPFIRVHDKFENHWLVFSYFPKLTLTSDGYQFTFCEGDDVGHSRIKDINKYDQS